MEVMIPNEMRFRLDGAILFYRRWSEYGYSYSAHNVAAVLHKVNENGSLAPGRALDMKALELQRRRQVEVSGFQNFGPFL